MRLPERTDRLILVPFDKAEGTDLSCAAKTAGKSVGTVRNWCVQEGIGRRIGNGAWVVSKVALAMFLDGDQAALDAYHSGDRESSLVTSYFERVGVRAPASKASKSSNL